MPGPVCGQGGIYIIPTPYEGWIVQNSGGAYEPARTQPRTDPPEEPPAATAKSSGCSAGQTGGTVLLGVAMLLLLAAARRYVWGR